MRNEYLCLEGGTIYDPAHGIQGEVRDLWLCDGKVVAAPSTQDLPAIVRLSVRGYVVMPGGVDLHSHIVGPKVNAARRMLPELHRGCPAPTTIETANDAAPLRSGTTGPVPSTFMTGYQYLGMGYTTALDAAISPLMARHAQLELEDTPCIDKGFLAVVGDMAYAMQAIRANDERRLDDFLGWLLTCTGAYGAKIVNPGGVAAWKSRAHRNVAGLDDLVEEIGLTPRAVVTALAAAIDRLQLPHPLHIHTNHLGIPGNWTTTLDTMRSLEGHRGHFTHIQYHSYGGHGESEEGFDSRVPELVDFVSIHPELSVDVGQVLFGSTVSMTGDSPLGYYLAQLTGAKWHSQDIEMEGGCGVSAITYRQKNLVHAWQWAIGLEWYLLMQNPWQIAMTTDHPNGGAFIAYPQVIRLLMDRAYRREKLEQVHPLVRQRSILSQLEREYTLSEIAIITRAAPARMLGLASKGHLGVGADADVAVYLPDRNWEQMFQFPRYVIQAGEILIDNGQPRTSRIGKLWSASPSYDRDAEVDIARWWNDHMTTRFPRVS